MDEEEVSCCQSLSLAALSGGVGVGFNGGKLRGVANNSVAKAKRVSVGRNMNIGSA